jgi:hypothetical protein
MDNVNELYEKFPYDFTAPESTARIKTSQVISFKLVLNEYKRDQLASYMKHKNINNEVEAMTNLMFKALSLWGK